jgi:hypothetical protein
VLIAAARGNLGEFSSAEWTYYYSGIDVVGQTRLSRSKKDWETFSSRADMKPDREC